GVGVAGGPSVITRAAVTATSLPARCRPVGSSSALGAGPTYGTGAGRLPAPMRAPVPFRRRRRRPRALPRPPGSSVLLRPQPGQLRDRLDEAGGRLLVAPAVGVQPLGPH